MMAGSGINAKPSAATELSMEGLSLNVKSTASRAPPAWSRAETMARAVCGNSRSAVISGPRSDRGSMVRSNRRKLFFCTATHGCGQKPEQKKSNMRPYSGIRSLLVSLVLENSRQLLALSLQLKNLSSRPERSAASLVEGPDLLLDLSRLFPPNPRNTPATRRTPPPPATAVAVLPSLLPHAPAPMYCHAEPT